MNSPIHFCTGYLAGRALGYREHRFEPLYMAVAAYAPDFDSSLSRFSPLFAHGIWTHTLVGIAVISVLFSAVIFGILVLVKGKSPIPYPRLLGLALLGGMTHLLLDGFTFYYSEGDAAHHMYFWPVWDFPWHINTVFPGVSFTLRVWVEVVYSVAVAACILLYQGLYKRQNPFRVFDPRGWFRESA